MYRRNLEPLPVGPLLSAMAALFAVCVAVLWPGAAAWCLAAALVLGIAALVAARGRARSGCAALLALLAVLGSWGLALSILTGGEARGPGPLSARRREQRCVQTLQDLGRATSLYLSDYDQRFPPGRADWVELIGPYRRDRLTWSCPESTATPGYAPQMQFAGQTVAEVQTGEYQPTAWFDSADGACIDFRHGCDAFFSRIDSSLYLLNRAEAHAFGWRTGPPTPWIEGPDPLAALAYDCREWHWESLAGRVERLDRSALALRERVRLTVYEALLEHRRTGDEQALLDLARTSNDWASLIWQGEEFRGLTYDRMALECFKRSVSVHSEADNLYNLGLSVSLYDGPRSSLSYFRDALEKRPGDPEITCAMADREIRCDRAAAAEERLSALVEVHPEYGRAWLLLARARRDVGRPEDSYAAYQRALEAGHDRLETHLSCAITAFRASHRDQLVRSVQALRREAPLAWQTAEAAALLAQHDGDGAAELPELVNAITFALDDPEVGSGPPSLPYYITRICALGHREALVPLTPRLFDRSWLIETVLYALREADGRRLEHGTAYRLDVTYAGNRPGKVVDLELVVAANSETQAVALAQEFMARCGTRVLQIDVRTERNDYGEGFAGVRAIGQRSVHWRERDDRELR